MPQCPVAHNIQRIEIQRSLVKLGNVIRAYIPRIPVRVIDDRVREVRVEFHGAGKRYTHVGVATGDQDFAEHILNFGEPGVKQQCGRRLLFGLFEITQVKECTCQPAPGQRGFGVGLDGLAIVIHGSLQRFEVHVLALKYL